MLTADLVRARDNGEEVVPRYLKLDGKGAGQLMSRAEALVGSFEEHAQQRARKGELDEAVQDLVGDGTDYLLTRGLTKLLEDRSEFETHARVDPARAREVVFGLAARSHPVVEVVDAVHTTSRAQVMEQAARELTEDEAAPITVEELEEALYGDLPENQRLVRFRGLDARQLLDRYNLGLAQAVLFRAERLVLTLHEPRAARCRQLFRYMKFYRLMHTVTRCERDRWEIVLDGPMSLFQSTQKYGLQMALFLPALLLADQWELEASIRWGTERVPRIFRLDSDCGLVSHYPDKGVYITEEQAHLERRFRKLDSEWKLSRTAKLINLGGKTILSPDLTFTHKHDGRTAMLEIVGYWRKGWLKSRVQLLSQMAPKNLILAVSDRMRTDDDVAALGETPGITMYRFKGVIVAKRVLELVEDVAE